MRWLCNDRVLTTLSKSGSNSRCTVGVMAKRWEHRNPRGGGRGGGGDGGVERDTDEKGGESNKVQRVNVAVPFRLIH